MIYANWTGSFMAGAQPRITHLTEFRVPVTAARYAAVTSVVAAQIALLIVVGAMFGAYAKSVLNGAWLVVSQVSSSPGAVGALVREKGVADADVGRFVGEGKGEGCGGELWCAMALFGSVTGSEWVGRRRFARWERCSGLVFCVKGVWVWACDGEIHIRRGENDISWDVTLLTAS